MTIKCEVKLTTPEGTPLMALNLWWGRNKNSKIDQLHAFQSRALYQAVKIADLSGEKLLLFHTNNNWKFIFIYISSQLLKWYFVLLACNPCIHKSEYIFPIIIFKGFLSLGLYSQTKQGFQSPRTSKILWFW